MPSDAASGSCARQINPPVYSRRIVDRIEPTGRAKSTPGDRLREIRQSSRVDCAARHFAEPVIGAPICRARMQLEMHHFPAWPRLEIEHTDIGPADIASRKATDANTIAFSSEVDTGSREENASKQ
jgi:hypothetical protein